MKTKLLSLAVFAAALFFSANVFAQTAGSMTYTFTTKQIGTKTSMVVGVWIEDAAGTFTKTNILYTSGSTNDHFPTLKAKSGTVTQIKTGGVLGAITGATRKSTTTPLPWGPYSVSWDGKDANGTLVADGVYKVWVELSATSVTANTHEFINTGYSFTKGASIYDTSVSSPIADNTVLITNKIVWTPTALSLNSAYKAKVGIYPNPSNGVFNIDFNDIPVRNIDVVNILGQVVKSVKINSANAETTKSIDMSGQANGLYIINVSTNETSSSYKVILDK